MIIPKKVLEKWSKIRNQGDVKEIAIKANKSANTISTALNGGSCSSETFEVMVRFYEEREAQINNLLQKA